MQNNGIIFWQKFRSDSQNKNNPFTLFKVVSELNLITFNVYGLSLKKGLITKNQESLYDFPKFRWIIYFQQNNSANVPKYEPN